MGVLYFIRKKNYNDDKIVWYFWRFIYVVNKYLFIVYYMLINILVFGGIILNKTGKVLVFMRLDFGILEIGNK